MRPLPQSTEERERGITVIIQLKKQQQKLPTQHKTQGQIIKKIFSMYLFPTLLEPQEVPQKRFVKNITRVLLLAMSCSCSSYIKDPSLSLYIYIQ